MSRTPWTRRRFCASSLGALGAALTRLAGAQTTTTTTTTTTHSSNGSTTVVEESTTTSTGTASTTTAVAPARHPLGPAGVGGVSRRTARRTTRRLN